MYTIHFLLLSVRSILCKKYIEDFIHITKPLKSIQIYFISHKRERQELCLKKIKKNTYFDFNNFYYKSMKEILVFNLKQLPLYIIKFYV